MNRFTKITLITCAFVAMVSAAPKSPETSAPAKKVTMAQELGLSADQQTKLATLRKENGAAQKVIRDQISAKQKELNALVKSGAIKSSTDMKIKEISALHERILSSRVDYLMKVKMLMTPAQFEKFMTRQSAAKDQHKGTKKSSKKSKKKK